MYQGTISGGLKDALTGSNCRAIGTPLLHDKVIGLISAAGGTQGLQAEKLASDHSLHSEAECARAAERVASAAATPP
jgi:hypothetical protein